jgi:hypothetical protein
MRLDAREHLLTLVGREIRTVTGRPNTVLSVGATQVVVATSRSPKGNPVPIADVQAAMEMLVANSEITIDVETVGYRSAFIGAALATLPGAIVLPTSPPTIALRR